MPQPTFLRRYQDLKVQYDRDNGSIVLLRQRVYRSRDGEIETPITSLLLARVIETDNAVPPRSYTPRRLLACFENDQNRLGQTELTAFIPYAPGDPNLKNHAQEILNFGNVANAKYFGESEDVEGLTDRFIEDLGDLLIEAIRVFVDDFSDAVAQQLLEAIIGLLLGALV